MWPARPSPRRRPKLTASAERWHRGLAIHYPVAYVYKVTLRMALRVLRPYAAVVPVEDVESRTVTRQTVAADTTPTAEQAMLLTACLARLPADQARAVRAHLAGFTRREIAHLYGWGSAVTRHRIYRGLRAVKTFALQEVA